MKNKKDLGALGENLAEALLRKRGYKILEKNFRSRFGEIDIVAQDLETLVFVEVKTRWNRQFGSPEESVGPHKIRLIEKTGQYFRLTHPGLPEAERIDVVAIEMEEDGKIIREELIKNAAF